MINFSDRFTFFDKNNEDQAEKERLIEEEKSSIEYKDERGLWYNSDYIKIFNIPTKGNRNLDRVTKEDITGDSYYDKLIVFLNKDNSVDTVFIPDLLRDDMVDDETQTDMTMGVK